MGNKLLQDIKVIDCSRTLAGAQCTMTLADFGAWVLRVETPEYKEIHSQEPAINGVSAVYANMHRGKHAAAIDWKTEEGRDLLVSILKDADVFLETDGAEEMKKHGLDYDSLHALYPDLIYASITTYGESGPYGGRPGGELCAQAMGGSMSTSGESYRIPTRAGYPVASVLGGLNAGVGILGALNRKADGSRGVRIDISMADCIFSSTAIASMDVLENGVRLQRTGSKGSRGAGPHDSFKAKGGYFILSCNEQHMFEKLATDCLEMPELVTDPRFDTMDHRFATEQAPDNQLKQIIEEWAADKDYRDCADKAVLVAKVPAAPVNTVADVFHDENIRNARGMFVQVHDPAAGDIYVTANPARMPTNPVVPDSSAPAYGEMTKEVLRRLGLHDESVEALKLRGIIDTI